eukprot:1446153-Rhodomonas_salina.2
MGQPEADSEGTESQALYLLVALAVCFSLVLGAVRWRLSHSPTPETWTWANVCFAPPSSAATVTATLNTAPGEPTPVTLTSPPAAEAARTCSFDWTRAPRRPRM